MMAGTRVVSNMRGSLLPDILKALRRFQDTVATGDNAYADAYTEALEQATEGEVRKLLWQAVGKS